MARNRGGRKQSKKAKKAPKANPNDLSRYPMISGFRCTKELHAQYEERKKAEQRNHSQVMVRALHFYFKNCPVQS